MDIRKILQDFLYLLAYVILSFFLFSFVLRIFGNIFMPDVAEKSFQVSPLYSSMDTTSAWWISTIVNIILSILIIGIIISIRKFQKKDAENWHNKAVSLIKLGHHEEAIQCLNKSLEINPKNAEDWNGKAFLLGKLGHYEEAIQCSNKSLEINPKNAEVWYNKALSLIYLDRYEEAIQCLNKSLEINPEDIAIWRNKAFSLMKLGHHEESIQCLNKALAIEPQNKNP